MNLEPFANIITKAFEISFGIMIAFGAILMLYGLMLLIFNRRVIKALYFIGGFIFFGLLSVTIGLGIISTKVPKDENTNEAYPTLGRDVIITLGCSAGIGLIFGILAACFGKFGIVIVGMSLGFTIGTAIGILTGNGIALIVLIIAFIIIGGALCGIFKRPAEVVCSAIMGGLCFGIGYEILFMGILFLQTFDHLSMIGNLTGKGDPDGFIAGQDYLARIAFISSIVLTIVTIIGFGGYHIFTYKKNHSKEANQSTSVRETPITNPV